MNRSQEKFPTRQYPYRRDVANGLELAVESTSATPADGLTAGNIYRFVLGIDQQPRPMTTDEIQKELNDAFAVLLLRTGIFPQTLRAVLQSLDAINNDASNGLPDQRSFLVADGGQIHWSAETAAVPRSFRFAISRSRNGRTGLLISTGTNFDSTSEFLQALAWDPVNAVFNYYERRGGVWVWAGNSWHSLAPPSRGKGPFDSHVNGSLVMKELKFPWTHWHSQSSAITDDVLPPNDPLRNESLWRNKSGAEDFELSVVRPGIEQWTRTRIKASISDPTNGILKDSDKLLWHLFESTTFNLIASSSQSRSVTPDSQVRLPMTFFFNSDVLLDLIELEPDISVPQASGDAYLQSLQSFDFHLKTEGFRQDGDTHVAFLVPEFAFEDLAVISELIQRKCLTNKFVACVLMIDFANPVSSLRRAALMKYVPPAASFREGRCNLEAVIVANLEAEVATRLALNEDISQTTEQEFLDNWRLGDDWREQFSRRIEAYMARVQDRLLTQDGFNDCVRLAESRRREFRRRPLAEFDLTLPVTNIPLDAPELQMLADGTVGPKMKEGDT